VASWRQDDLEMGMRVLFVGLTLLLSLTTLGWEPTSAAPKQKSEQIKSTSVSEIKTEEVRSIELYMRKVFDNQRIRIVLRPKKPASAEVYIAEQFVGIVFLDNEDGDRSFQFQMAILQEDLKPGR
jgi:hypothetical protein